MVALLIVRGLHRSVRPWFRSRRSIDAVLIEYCFKRSSNSNCLTYFHRVKLEKSVLFDLIIRSMEKIVATPDEFGLTNFECRERSKYLAEKVPAEHKATKICCLRTKNIVTSNFLVETWALFIVKSCFMQTVGQLWSQPEFVTFCSVCVHLCMEIIQSYRNYAMCLHNISLTLYLGFFVVSTKLLAKKRKWFDEFWSMSDARFDPYYYGFSKSESKTVWFMVKKNDDDFVRSNKRSVILHALTNSYYTADSARTSSTHIAVR